MENNIKRATNFEIFKYGIGGIGVNIPFCLIIGYLMYFMTDVAGMPGALAGLILLTVNTFDAINDPVIGSLADRTNSKWGRYRPFLMFASPILAVVCVGLFTVPDFSMSGKIVYYVILYILYSIGYTSMTIPFQALTPLMSDDMNQRNVVVMSRSMLGNVGFFGIYSAVIPLVALMGNTPDAWQKVAAIFGALTVICMWVCASGAKRHDQIKPVTNHEKFSVKRQIDLVKQNKALVIMFCSMGLFALVTSVLSATNMYFYKYVVGDVSYMAKYGLISLAMTFVVAPFVPKMIKKFGKKNIIMVGLGIFLISPITLLLVRPFDNMVFMMALLVVNGMSAVTINITTWSLIPDCVEYGEWKTGVQSAGLVSSSYTFVAKFTAAFSGLLVGSILQMVGYVPDQVQTAQAMNGILYVYTIVPIIGAIVSGIIIKFFPVDQASLEVIMEENRRNRVAAFEQ